MTIAPIAPKNTAAAQEVKDLQGQIAKLNKDKDQLGKLAEDFEAVFLELVLKNMRNTVQKSELVDGGNGEEVFRSLLDTEYAKSMASQKHGGIAESIEKQLVSVINGQTKALEKRLGQLQYGQQALQGPAKQAKINEDPKKPF